jgi:hypothetical protein
MGPFEWRLRHTRYFGRVFVPFAEVILVPRQAGGKPHKVLLQVDSGAIVSTLRRSAADLLGLRLEGGRRVELGGVAGGHVVAWVHELHVGLFPAFAPVVPFAIAEVERVPNLLGRIGVFDTFQVDFDVSLTHTRITKPWLTAQQRRLWEFFIDTDDHILQRIESADLPEPVREAARRFIEHAVRVVVAAASLIKLHRDSVGPLLIRTAFELAAQFEYLMREDATVRAQRYLDYAHITHWEASQRVVGAPGGPVGQLVADSPARAGAEAQIRTDYERVREQFLDRSGKVSRTWYGMSLSELSRQIGWQAEYDMWYRQYSAWVHGDPFATGRMVRPEGFDTFWHCMIYYGRMLKRVADAGRIVLTAEQNDVLNRLCEPFC